MKNHWLKKREQPQWQQITVLCDASGVQLYLDGELTEFQYYTYCLSEVAINQIIAEEDAKFMEIVGQHIDLDMDVPEPEICMLPIEEPPLEHIIDMMGI